jgi:lysyl-tRNA synthetase class 2
MMYLRVSMKCSPEAQRLRSRVYQETRRFFQDAGYLEVEVPVLSDSLIPESHLEVFETTFVDTYRDPPHGSSLYLIPSPEVFLKRLLAEGWPSLFTLSRAFRNAESRGRHHNPEFTMLEFYTWDADYRDSIEVTERWITHLARVLGPEVASYREARRRAPGIAYLSDSFATVAVDELMQRFAGFPAEWAQSRERLIAAARAVGIDPDPDESFESVFNRTFVHFVEPELVDWPAVVVRDYPAEVPTLARRKGDHGEAVQSVWAERWELYLCGLEVANCYTEATHPDEVRTFFESERQKEQSNLIAHPVDSEYPLLLGAATEQVSGVAVGMDRVLMALLGATEIEEVLVFPTNSML